MDLVSPPSTKVVITMDHTTRQGEPKILKECRLPLTGVQCVDRIITDLCVFDVNPKTGLILKELAKGIQIQEIQSKTECSFEISSDLKETY